jgi:hypothetical protein
MPKINYIFFFFQGGGDGTCCEMGREFQVRLQNVSQHLNRNTGPLSPQNICPQGEIKMIIIGAYLNLFFAIAGG